MEDDQFVTSPMLVGLAAEQAEKYSRDLAANVKRGIGSWVRSGKPWGEPAYGYGKGDDGHWTPNSAERVNAERIVRERTEHGLSYSGIARALNADGVRSRTGRPVVADDGSPDPYRA